MLASLLLAEYGEKPAEWFEANPVRVHVAGRMMFQRVMGKASFAKLQDRTGQIQIFLQRDALGDSYEAFKKYDVGDILAAVGTLFKTRTGELSVRVDNLRLLTKSLRPLPDKWHGMADVDMRYRQRYVDLIVNEHSRNVFVMRNQILKYLRDFLESMGFLEVETPMLQSIPGGAAARPFKTHHNALDMDMFLRIAPELFLKRLTVGGFERVYEINRNFRNEGVSTRHNPEFTMLELYVAYADYNDLIVMVERAMQGLADVLFGKRQITYQGRRVRPVEAFQAHHRDRRGGREPAGRLRPRACPRGTVPARAVRKTRHHVQARRRRRQTADRAVREVRRRHLHGTDVRLRIPGRGEPAVARE